VRKLLSLTLLIGAATAYAAETALVDPTRPSGFSDNFAAHDTSAARLTLTLIRLGSEPQAVINGKTVAPGETIAGYRLLSLQPASATLAGPNGRTVLQLAPTIRKSSSIISVQKR